MRFTKLVKRLCILFLLAVTPAFAQAAHHTDFTWTSSSTIGATYNAYKQAGCTGAFVKINTAPILISAYTDSGMADGEINCYLFTSVLGTSESNQANSEVIRTVTPVTPTITPGAAFVAPPTKPIAKPV